MRGINGDGWGGGMGIEAGGGNVTLSLGAWLLRFMEAERRVG